MIEYWDFYTYGYDAPQGGQGMATTLPVDSGRDYGAELREVVKEVTGKPIDEPTPRRIGFM